MVRREASTNRYKDLEGIFHQPIELSQINHDRFGRSLDRFHEAGCRNIFRRKIVNMDERYKNSRMPKNTEKLLCMEC